jgi:hypothetical protein
MKKVITGIMLLVAILVIVSVVPSAVASTVCSHPVYPDIQVKKVGHWVYLDFYAQTKSLQVPKLYSKFVYLTIDKKDLSKVGLRYHEDKPMKQAYWSYTLIQVPRDGKLYLGSRKLWLVNGVYHINVTYYVCGVNTIRATLDVKGGIASIHIEQSK